MNARIMHMWLFTLCGLIGPSSVEAQQRDIQKTPTPSVDQKPEHLTPANPPKVGAAQDPLVANSAIDVAQVDLDDPAFDRLVDRVLLARAWQDHDPALMADLGLQLAEGERILFRPHKAFESGRIIELAVYLAVDVNDKITLDRLSHVAKKTNSKHLSRLILEAPDLMKNPSADAHPIASSIESISPTSLAAHQAIVREIRALRISGDRAGLESLGKYVKSRKDLHDTQHQHIGKLINDASSASSMPLSLKTTITKLDRLVSTVAADPKTMPGSRTN